MNVVKRVVLIEKLHKFKEIVVDEDIIYYNELSQRTIKYFLYDKSPEMIRAELREMLFTREWFGVCPTPFGHSYIHRLIMISYIPKDFKKVCEDYLDTHWKETIEIRKNWIQEWINECHA